MNKELIRNTIYKSAKLAITAGVLLAFLSVCLGAFAAHGLKDVFNDYQLGIFETAVRYQMYHALALILLGIFAVITRSTVNKTACVFIVGIVVFSGSLYALAALQISRLGAITPIGGLCLLVAWLSFFVKALRLKPDVRNDA